jgi:glycosyltransferase involved in cell wall biosynthesis
VLHVVVVNYVYDRACRDVDHYPDYYFLLVAWATALQQAGAQVTVCQRFHRAATFTHAGVKYCLCADQLPPWLRTWQWSRPFQRQVSALVQQSLAAHQPTVVHVNSLLFPLASGLLRASLPTTCPMVLQHHGELPRAGWRSWLQCWGLRRATAYWFTNAELAQGWIATRAIPDGSKVQEVMEISSALRYQSRPEARAQTQMVGDPVLFWAGNLKPNKDPLTILAGFRQILPEYPQARLYMAYRENELEQPVIAAIAADPRLASAVTLLGNIPYGQIAPYFNSADLFVQGSYKEGSGIALLDALACGVVPVVTDIPAFRTITQDGTVGALWPPGDVAALVAALRRTLAQPVADQSTRARQLFADQWSYAAIGRRMVQLYKEMV